MQSLSSSAPTDSFLGRGDEEVRLALPLPRLMTLLTATWVVLLVLHLLVVSSYLDGWRFAARDRFFFDHENNLPTFFSTFILLLAGVQLALIASIKQRQADPFRRQWWGMAVLFVLLAVDEAASLHELLIQPLRVAFGFTGLLWFGWVLAGAAFALLFAVLHLRFLASLPSRVRWWFLLCGAAYVGGAVGLEMVGGKVFLAGQPSGELAPYMLVMTLEESLEMVAILLFNGTLMNYVRGCCPCLHLDLRTGKSRWWPPGAPMQGRTGNSSQQASNGAVAL